jgi:transcription initiation factor IIF auxiliary subunit
VRASNITSDCGEIADARIVFKKPPFRIDEKGWGEFDMSIVLTAVGKGGDHTLAHDLNFQSERYEAKHQVVSSVRVR